MNKKIVLLVFFLGILLGVRPITATRLCTVPGDWYNIQAALDDDTCSEINVAAGTWFHTLTVDRDVTIRGEIDADSNPITIVDGNRGGSVVTLVGTPTVVLSQLVLQNGYTPESGGGIYQPRDSHLTLENVHVLNNESGMNGSGLTSIADVVINGAWFANNDSTAISITQGSLTAESLIVEDNLRGLFLSESVANLRSVRFARHTIGGIVAFRSTLHLEFAEMRENIYPGQLGGAVRFSGSDSELSIRDSAFIGNGAFSGGALYLSLTPPFGTENVVLIERTSFDGNRASQSINSPSKGGAISVSGNRSNRLVIRNSSFTGNSADFGGAIHNLYSDIQIEIDSVGFQNNEATTLSGGAIYMGHDNPLIITNSSFDNNRAAEHGGAIANRNDFGFQTSTPVTLTNVAMTNNQAGGNGGAISLDDEFVDLHVQGAYFANNQAANGGAILVRGSEGGSFDMSQSRIEDNSASGDGGGIFGAVSTTFSTSQIERNTAQNGGGFYLTANATVRDASLLENEAVSNGGGVYLANNEFDAARLQIVGNVAGNDGGGMFTTGRASVTDVLYANNSAGNNGGGIASNQEFVFSQGAFAENTANGSGGALYSVGSNARSILTNMSMGNNRAAEGDSIYTDGAVEASYMSIGYDLGQSSSVYKVNSAEIITFDNAIVNGSADNPNLVNCKGATDQISGSNSFDSDGSCTFADSRNLSGVDPLMEPFADNGGFAPTFRLLDGSPAIGMGQDCPQLDQRGFVRSLDNCDVGAYQTDAEVPTAVTYTIQSIESHRATMLLTLTLTMLSMFTVLHLGVVNKQLPTSRGRNRCSET